jgi:ribosomal protein S6
MFRYEVFMLTIPEITKDEVATIESTLNNIIQHAKGKMFSFERWGKYALAYPIRKNEYGVYCLARFDLPELSDVLSEINSFLAVKLENTVMRFLISRLDETAPLTYQRPLSLEEAPAKSPSSFLKERGFMSDEGFDRKNTRGFEGEHESHDQDMDVA